MNRPTRTSSPSLSAVLARNTKQGIKSWTEPFEVFCNIHRAWWDRRGQDLTMWLPRPIVESLSASTSKHQYLDPQDVHAENDFRELCTWYANGVVGVAYDFPVSYDHFDSPETGTFVEFLNESSGSDRQELGDWATDSNAVAAALMTMKGRLNVYRKQFIGWAAAVTFRKEYRDERDLLRRSWQELAQQPSLQQITVHEVGPVLLGGASTSLADPTLLFIQRYRHFLRRWQLASLSHWELPHPLSAQESMTLEEAVRLFGPDWRISALPAHVNPIPPMERVLVERRLRESNAKNVGLPVEMLEIDLAGTPALGQAFRMYLFEMAARGRYKAKGIIGRIKEGFARHFHQTTDRIDQLRSYYRKLIAS